jgi:hypothetical protein
MSGPSLGLPPHPFPASTSFTKFYDLRPGRNGVDA